MKKNRYGGIVAAVLLCALFCLTACQKAKPGSTPAPNTAPPAATDFVISSATAVPDNTADAAEAKKAYAAALDDVLKQHVLPDGTDLGLDPNADASGNQFAIFDVDADGREELIVVYSTTYTAGQTAAVYDYDAGTRTLYPELSEYPLLTFFDNGVVKALWSHNQGLAGSFWPFNLYRYDAAADRYVLIGSVDAWEKNFAETDPAGNAFPSATDQSGSGFVYYIMEGGEIKAVPPVDEAAYLTWYNTHLANAAEQTLPYRALTEENLSAID